MGSLVVWTDALGERVLPADVGVQMMAPRHRRSRYRFESEDGTNIQTLASGLKTNEAVLDLRMIEAGKTLDDARAAGLDGLDLTIYPDDTDADRFWVVQLISADEPSRDGEAGRSSHLWRSSWVVRRTDGGVFS